MEKLTLEDLSTSTHNIVFYSGTSCSRKVKII